jgi:threonylcarbamoyladenosine tRNA methylthiotransferase MtaB
LTNPFGGLAALVRRLQQEVEVPRFRLSSVEPNLFEHDLILALKDSPRFVPHFHIPLQSGSDSVLGRMQRRYRTRNYRALLLHLQETWQDAGLGADVLVGFPGESEAEFRETLDFVSEMPLAYLHVFTYSERPDTPAAAMRPKVPQALRLERNRLLTEVSLRKQLEFARRFEGQKRPVLVEHEAHRSLENPMSTMRGYTPNYLRVEMPYDPLWAGTEVMVEVGKATLRDQEVFVQGRILESTPLD